MAGPVTIRAPGGYPSPSARHGSLSDDCDLDADAYAPMHDRDYLDSIGYVGDGWPVWCRTHGKVADVDDATLVRLRRRQRLARMTLKELAEFSAAIDEARAARLADGTP